MLDKKIELTENDKLILQYICINYTEISSEIDYKKMGTVKRDSRLNYPIGFYLTIGDIMIEFESSNNNDYVGMINIYYKELLIFKSNIMSGEKRNVWHRDINHLLVTDGYHRGIQSRHNLDSAFRYVMKVFEFVFYIPYLEKVEKQLLHKDILYDEFEKLISS